MVTRSFPAWPDSVPAARGYVTDLLDQVPPQVCQTAALLVSELVSNVVRHSGAHSFEIEVHVHASEGLLSVGVTDTGTGDPVVRRPPVTAEHGRGLQLVDTLSDRWGARYRREPHAKTLWFELTYEARRH